MRCTAIFRYGFTLFTSKGLKLSIKANMADAREGKAGLCGVLCVWRKWLGTEETLRIVCLACLVLLWEYKAGV